MSESADEQTLNAMFDAIRQELGGTYSITVTPTFQKAPSPMYAIRIEWTCDPARTTALVQRVFDEIDFVRTTSLRQEGMASLRQTVKRELDDQQQSNGYWLGQIARRYQDGGGGDLAAIDRAAELLQVSYKTLTTKLREHGLEADS